jgi:hypothetical protein
MQLVQQPCCRKCHITLTDEKTWGSEIVEEYKKAKDVIHETSLL